MSNGIILYQSKYGVVVLGGGVYDSGIAGLHLKKY